MMKKVIKVLTLCILVAFMTSCQTKEEKVINDAKKLAERIEKQSDSFSDSQWENIYNEFESIQEQAKECEFTSEQRTEFAKAEAELTTAIAKQKAIEVGSGIKDAIDQGANVLNGVIDGIKEGLDKDENTK